MSHPISFFLLIVILSLFGYSCYQYGRWSILRKFGKKRGGYNRETKQA